MSNHKILYIHNISLNRMKTKGNLKSLLWVYLCIYMGKNYPYTLFKDNDSDPMINENHAYDTHNALRRGYA